MRLRREIGGTRFLVPVLSLWIAVSASGCTRNPHKPDAAAVTIKESASKATAVSPYDYWQECKKHLGPAPTFDVKASVEIPIHGERVNADPHRKSERIRWADLHAGSEPLFCDKPGGVIRDKTNLGCVPNNRVMRVTTQHKGADVEWVVAYRRIDSNLPAPVESLDGGEYLFNAHGIIGYNTATGATCYADAQLFDYFMDSGRPVRVDHAAWVAGKSVEELLAEFKSRMVNVFPATAGGAHPNLTEGSREDVEKSYLIMATDCSACHANGPWVRNPWVSQVKMPDGRPVVPKPRKLELARKKGPEGNGGTEPYFLVSADDVRAYLKVYSRDPDRDHSEHAYRPKFLKIASPGPATASANRCTTCHEIGEGVYCGQYVPYAFGVWPGVPNGFGIDFTNLKAFDGAVRDNYETLSNRDSWPQNGWHNALLGIRDEERARQYAPSLREVLACCRSYAHEPIEHEKCQWVEPPHGVNKP